MNNDAVLKRTPMFLNYLTATMELQARMVDFEVMDDTIKRIGFPLSRKNGYELRCEEITGRGPQFRVFSKYTESFGKVKVQGINRGPASYLFFKFKVNIKKDGKIVNGLVDIYKNGKMRISQGLINTKHTEPEKIREQIIALRHHVSKYFMTQAEQVLKNESVRSKINNITGSFEVNRVFSVANFAAVQRKSKPGIRLVNNFSHNGYQIIPPSYEPEIFPAVITGFKTQDGKKAFKMNITVNGKIQIIGIQTISDIQTVYGLANKYLDVLDRVGVLRPSGKKLTTNKNIRKGRVVGKLKGSTCPMPRRPNPDSFEGKCPSGQYIYPNPQGYPCCKKIPKSTTYSRNKVIEAFKKANVPIPKDVKAIFNIKNSPVVATNNKSNIEVKVVKGAKGEYIAIGNRDCMKMGKKALVETAAKLGIIVNPRATKDTICALIARKAGIDIFTKLEVPFRLRNTNYVARINGDKLKIIGGTRKRGQDCKTLSKTEVKQIGRVIGVNNVNKSTRPQICDAIIDKVIDSAANNNNGKQVQSPNSNLAKQLQRQLQRQSPNSNSNNLEAMLQRQLQRQSPNSNNNLEAMLQRQLQRQSPSPQRTINKNITNAIGNNYPRYKPSLNQILPNISKEVKNKVNTYSKTQQYFNKPGGVQRRLPTSNEVSRYKKASVNIIKNQKINPFIKRLQNENINVLRRETLPNGTVIEVVRDRAGMESSRELI